MTRTAQLDRLFQALADPTRRAVLARLSAGPQPAGTLAAPFDMTLPSFMQHLTKLEAGGLIATRKEGRTRICELRPGGLAPVRAWMEEQRALWNARRDNLEACLTTPMPPPRPEGRHAMTAAPSTELRLHRILKAPRDRVWQCWTTPELLLPWFCPKPHRTTEAIIDPRPGGRFFTRMRVDGNDHPNEGSFLHVDPGNRLVFTDMMLADWQPVDAPGLGFTAELIFRDHPEGTDYTAIARHRTPEGARQHEAMGFSQGWGTVAAQLEVFAAGLAP